MKRSTKKHRSQKLPLNSPVQYSPKKHLGQNFLVDNNIKERIIEACDLKSTDSILEIGPGLGSLTKEIALRVKNLTAIEIDKKLVEHLNETIEEKNVKVIHGDFLKYDLKKLTGKYKVIANLPYNISTPIIEKILPHAHKFSSLYITIQFELAQRITSSKGSKQYGSFTLFTQYHATPKLLFKIRNTAFRPIPQVSSGFLKLDLGGRTKEKVLDQTLLFEMIQKAFQQRRKTLLNALSKVCKKDILLEAFENVKLDQHLRPENLSLNNFIELSNELCRLKKKRG